MQDQFCGGCMQVLDAAGAYDDAATQTAFTTHRAHPCTSGAPWTGDTLMDYTTVASRSTIPAPAVGGIAPEVLNANGNITGPESRPKTRITGGTAFNWPQATAARVGLDKEVVNETTSIITITVFAGDSFKIGTRVVTTTFNMNAGDVLKAAALASALWRKN